MPRVGMMTNKCVFALFPDRLDASFRVSEPAHRGIGADWPVLYPEMS